LYKPTLGTVLANLLTKERKLQGYLRDYLLFTGHYIGTIAASYFSSANDSGSGD